MMFSAEDKSARYSPIADGNSTIDWFASILSGTMGILQGRYIPIVNYEVAGVVGRR